MHLCDGSLRRRPNNGDCLLNIRLRDPIAFFVRQFAGNLTLGVARAAGLHLANP